MVGVRLFLSLRTPDPSARYNLIFPYVISTPLYVITMKMAIHPAPSLVLYVY